MSRNEPNTILLDHRRIPPRGAHSYTKMPALAGTPLSPAVAFAELRGAPPTFTPLPSKCPANAALRSQSVRWHTQCSPLKQGEPPAVVVGLTGVGGIIRRGYFHGHM